MGSFAIQILNVTKCNTIKFLHDVKSLQFTAYLEIEWHNLQSVLSYLHSLRLLWSKDLEFEVYVWSKVLTA